MSLIVKRGVLPTTPHTEFYAKEGVLALEEIHGTYGFSGPFSRKMHVRSYPTEQVKVPKTASFNFCVSTPKEAEVYQPLVVQTGDMPFEGNALDGRRCIFFGPKTKASIVKPVEGFPENTFFRNGENHELYYVQEGEGVLRSEYGNLAFRKEAYVCVPKGTTYQIELSSNNAFFLLIESVFPIEWPQHYMNHSGQAMMIAPVVETEIELPELPDAIDERGEFSVLTQHNGGKISDITLGHHPFDVVGWEGAIYPFLFDINNHHGIARAIHSAPPVHQTFQAGNVPYNGFSLCSFVPQMAGWHKKEVPAPYAHYNVDSDEIMFFCNASYGARKGVIKDGTFTFHPGGIPHSPHGNAALNSLDSRGKMLTRLAVMLDTCLESLSIAEAGWKYREKDYATSWSEEDL